jgi:hypothetical protein
MINVSDSVETFNKIKIKCYNCNSLVRRDFMTRHRKTRKCIDSPLNTKSKIDKIDIDIELYKKKIEILEFKKNQLLENINEPN